MIQHFISYMANKTEYQTPCLKFLDMKLTYQEPELLEKKNLWQAFHADEIRYEN